MIKKVEKMKGISLILLAFVMLQVVSASYMGQKNTIMCDKGKTQECNFDITYINNAAPEVLNEGSLRLETFPLMEVEGRNGFGQDIDLHYNAGVRVKQEASWVGLGWNIDMDFITRSPKGYADDYENTGHLDDPADPLDNFYSPWGVLVLDEDGDFVPEEWEPIIIDIQRGPNGEITKWTVNDDGTIYVFEKPVYTQIDPMFNVTKKVQTYNADGWSVEYTTEESKLIQPYAYVWYLTEIRSHDYRDLLSTPVGPDVILPSRVWPNLRSEPH